MTSRSYFFIIIELCANQSSVMWPWYDRFQFLSVIDFWNKLMRNFENSFYQLSPSPFLKPSALHNVNNYIHVDFSTSNNQIWKTFRDTSPLCSPPVLTSCTPPTTIPASHCRLLLRLNYKIVILKCNHLWVCLANPCRKCGWFKFRSQICGGHMQIYCVLCQYIFVVLRKRVVQVILKYIANIWNHSFRPVLFPLMRWIVTTFSNTYLFLT